MVQVGYDHVRLQNAWQLEDKHEPAWKQKVKSWWAKVANWRPLRQTERKTSMTTWQNGYKARQESPRNGGGGRDWSWWLSRLAILGFVGLIGGLLAGVILFVVFSRDLPSPDRVVRREGYATQILDRNGKSLYDVFEEEKRIPVEWEQIPVSLRHATIAIEDKDFYTHPGFDIYGMLRGFSRLFTRGRAQGGSTLTQQLVKNVLLTSERSLTRKIKEFVLAVQLERKFSKDQILRMYLNEAPYGGTAHGVEAAAELYFNKPVRELSTLESAVLAGMPQSPSNYSPFGSTPEAYKDRTKNVLRRMNEDGYLSNDEYEQAKLDLESVQFATDESTFEAPHFVIFVKDLLVQKYGEELVEGGGLRVTTTLDLDLQNKAQEIVTEEINKVKDLNITNGAAMVMHPQSGEILAMIGSRGYNDPDIDGKVNVPLTLQQPGSTIKPVTYAAGLREGYTLSTMIMDVQTEFPGGVNQPPYKPVSYDGKYRGPVLMREALGSSLNVPAVKMLALVGIRKTLALAYDMGLSTLSPTDETMSRVGLSLTLGGGDVKMIELISAYSAFANGGKRVDPVAILKVEDTRGQVLETHNPASGKQVLSPEEAWLITNALADNNARLLAFSDNNAMKIPGREVAAKTGTTNDKRDNWTVGWTPSRIVTVWVGNNDNSPMKQLASGVTGAAPIWRRILLTSIEGMDAETFERPSGIVDRDVDLISGYSAHHDFPSKKEYFISGTEPVAEDPIHMKLAVCKSEGKLATPVDVANGNSEEREFIVFKEQDPFESTTGTNKWQEAILNWVYATHKDDPKYNAPKDYCGGGQSIVVKILEPGDRSQIDSNQVKIRAEPVSQYSIAKVEFWADGKLLSSFSQPPFEDTANLSKGPHEIKVKARDDQGHEAESSIKIGVQVPWDWSPSPTPGLMLSITPALEAGPSATPTP